MKRFIPTGAGNIATHKFYSKKHPVHPHRCGEHKSIIAPLVPVMRFIPTGAGNIPLMALNILTHPVHPHRRGEHGSPFSRLVSAAGSSPQARGTYLLVLLFIAIARFIPIGAGNIDQALTYLKEQAVHPHRRGEHKPYVKL